MTRQNAPLSIKGAAGSNAARPLRSRTPPPNGSASLRTGSDRLIILTSEDEQSARGIASERGKLRARLEEMAPGVQRRMYCADSLGTDGQGDAEHAASTAVQMLDQATGMESRRIHERIIAVRDALGGMSDGRASAELTERIADLTGTHLHAR